MPAALKVDWELVKGFIVAGNSFKAASERYGIDEYTIRQRAHRHKWPSQAALSTMVSNTIKEKVKNEELTQSLADSMLQKLESLKRKGADIAEKALDHALKSQMKPESYSDLKKAWDIGAEAVGLKQEGSQVNVAFSLGSIEKQAEVIELTDI